MKPFGIGIDFGTTNSIASVWGEDIKRIQRERPIALWSQIAGEGNRPHPSVVWYTPDGSIIVGAEARTKMQELDGSLGHHFVRSVKRDLAVRKESVVHGGRKLQPFEVAAEVFKHVKMDAERRKEIRGHEFKECVVTVPVGFNGEQRREIRRAMERAGLALDCFLHEPFAALISHFYDPQQKMARMRGKRVAVFDWGGGTLDVCLVEGSQDGKQIYELAHDGIADRAGDEFDKFITRSLQDRFHKKHPELSEYDFETRINGPGRFVLNAERAKISLSKNEFEQVRVPKFLEGNPPLDLSERLTREEFESLVQEEVDAATECLLRCLRTARVSPEAVDYVLMVGGTSNIPCVSREIEKHFGARTIVANEPDAAIARGAAIVAAEGWSPFNAVPLGLKLSDESFFTILGQGEPLRANASKEFTFFCTDPRVGSANLIFCKKPVRGDQAVANTGEILQVPVGTQRPSSYRDLDRLKVKFTITSHATLLCNVIHSGNGERRELEITDISSGLSLL